MNVTKLAAAATSGKNILKLSELVDAIFNDPKSLTTVAKKTLITSNVFIDETILDNEAMVSIMGVANSLYVSYLLVALDIYNVEKYSEIDSAIGRISTESFSCPEVNSMLDDIDSNFNKVGINTEAADKQSQMSIEDSVKHLAIGKAIRFVFNVNNGSEVQQVPVTFMVQMLPVFMPADVSETLLELEFSQPLRRRWKMLRAGEISLKDFVLSSDIIKRNRKALNADTTNVLSRFYRRKIKSQRKFLDSIIKGKKNNNVANSILIYDSNSFNNACTKSTIDFDDFNDRQAFFNKAYAMIVIVVDSNYDLVNIYYNGIAEYQTTSLKTIVRNDSSGGINLTEVMKTIAKGNPPRF